MHPNEMRANLLAEVKLAERRLAGAQEKLGPVDDAIRAALRAGDRPAAERLAERRVELQREVERREADVRAAQDALDDGKRRLDGLERDLRTLRTAQALGGALEAFADAERTAGAADDMLRRLEEGAALDEARAELALGELEGAGGAAAPAPPPPPVSAAEDLLRELEGELGEP